MLTSAGEGAAGAEFTLQPDPGTLLMWRASLNHVVPPYESQETRISFNIVPEWANHYASDV